MDTLDDVIEFLNITEKQGFKNGNTAQGLKTALNTLFSILEPDQRNVQFVAANMATIKTRYQNLNKDVRGATVDVYVRRAEGVLREFEQWKTDRAGWERDAAASARGPRAAQEPKPKKAAKDEAPPAAATSTPPDPSMRVISVPSSSGQEMEARIPRDATLSDIRRLAYALLPYARDWDPDEVTPRQAFPRLVEGDSPSVSQ